MDFGSWTVKIAFGSQTRKFFRLAFEQDGTYSVTFPFHQERQATIFKALVVPGVPRNLIIQESMQDVSFEDDNQLRLCHFPDGHLAFCGLPTSTATQSDYTVQGVPAGDLIDGPVPPPSFRCTVSSVSEFQFDDDPSSSTLTIQDESIAPVAGADSYLFEGARFSGDYRELLIREGRDWFLRIVRADSGVLRLPALLAASDCNRQDFLALHVRRIRGLDGPGSGFSLIGYGERSPEDDGKPAEQLCAVYPMLSPDDLPRVAPLSFQTDANDGRQAD